MARKKAASGVSAEDRKKSASASVDEQLAKYRSMRDFGTTAEPRGGAGALESKAESKAEELPFVIQKHAATRLHYDFRLGWRGVLKSWAVAKGPSYSTKDKRLAVQVEDHPMEYGGFEGTIPKGQYGGGTVMLWDTGTWEPVGDADEGFRSGRLKFILHGKKLKGHWTLVRMGGRAAGEKKPNWLLIKEHDEYERPQDAQPITEEEPNSAVTGRDLEAIAKAEDHVWDSSTGLAAEERAKQAPAKGAPGKGAPAKETKKKPAAGRAVHAPQVEAGENAPREAMPKFVPPQLASSTSKPPQGPDWLHELKLDGYRMQGHVTGGKVKLLTRRGLDWTHRMPALAQALKTLSAKAAILDGEVVVLDEKGLSSFAELQAAFQEGQRRELTYYLFDLLHLNGRSTRELPLLERKEKLAALLSSFEPTGEIRYGDHVEGRSEEMYRAACEHGAEGIVSKKRDSRYLSGRSTSWLKIKCSRQQEFVIGGFTWPSKGGDGLGALLLGYYDDGGKLHYAGRVGTGFTQASQRLLRKKLDALETKTMPFAQIDTASRRGAHWVEPKLVAEVAFSTWTADGIVRQASFKGLREDKPAKEVRREEPLSLDEAQSAAQRDGQQDVQQDSNQNGAHAPHSKAAKKSAAGRHVRPQKATLEISLPPSLRLSHADKVLDQESGLTKQTLAEYYTVIAPHMLPFIADRPLSIVRCPSGTAAKCFFQKHVKPGLPKGVGSIEIADKKGGPPEPYITISTEEPLIGFAQMNVLELHPWGARNEDVERPDRLIFDLDPDAAIAWPTLAESADEVRKRLRKLGLKCFLKSTGGKGLHIVAPIAPEREWAEVKAFAHAFVQQMEAENPRLYLTKMSKAARKDRIYLDYLRNERGATAVAPFSPRSRAGVPVSVPMAWTELQQDAAPLFRVAEFREWMELIERDPWKELPKVQQSLTEEAIASVAPSHSNAGRSNAGRSSAGRR
jgi:bifunctional non-homologous end joining protein LigD